MDIFENGTVYQVHRPKNLIDTAWNYMHDVIKEFSPDLASNLYPSNDNSKSMNSSIKNTLTNSEEFYEKSSMYGYGLVKPEFSKSENKTQNKIDITKYTDKDKFIDMRFPPNSEYNTTQKSLLNQTQGTVDEINLEAFAVFKEEPLPAQKNDTDDFFQQNQNRHDVDMSEENYFPSSGHKKMNTKTSTNMKLIDYKTNDELSKNTTLTLYKIYLETEYNILNTTDFYKNQTQIDQDAAWQSKIDQYLNNPDKSKVRALALNDANNGIDTLKNNDYEIFYPVFQQEFFGWKTSLNALLRIRAKENKIDLKIVLSVEGIMHAEVTSKSFDVKISDTLGDLMKFVDRSVYLIEELIQRLTEGINPDFIAKLESFFKNIDDLIKFPFNIEQIYADKFKEKFDDIVKQVGVFVINILTTIDNLKHSYSNPLETLDFPKDLFNKSDISVLNYLNTYNKQLNDELKINKDIILIDILEIVNDNNTVQVFEDLMEDLDFIETLVERTYTNITDKVKTKLKNNYDDFLNFVNGKTRDNLNINLNKINTLLGNSQYSVSLGDAFKNIGNIFKETVNALPLWTDKTKASFKDIINNVRANEVNAIKVNAEGIIVTLKTSCDYVNGIARNKAKKFEEIKIYDEFFTKYSNIYTTFLDFRYKNFNKLFEIPMFTAETLTFLKEYLESFFTTYTIKESDLVDYLTNFKHVIDVYINQGVYAIKENNQRFLRLMDNSFNEDFFDISLKTLQPNLIFFEIFEKNLKPELSKYYIDNILKTLDELAKKKNSKIVVCKKEIDDLKIIFDEISNHLIEFINKITPNIANFLKVKEILDNQLIFIGKANEFIKINMFLEGNFFKPENPLDIEKIREGLNLNSEKFKAKIISEIDKIKQKVEASIREIYNSLLNSPNHYLIDCANPNLIVFNDEKKTCAKNFIYTLGASPCAIFESSLEELYSLPCPVVEPVPAPVELKCLITTNYPFVYSKFIELKLTPVEMDYKQLTISSDVQYDKIVSQINSGLQNIQMSIDAIVKGKESTFKDVTEKLDNILKIQKDAVQKFFVSDAFRIYQKAFSSLTNSTIYNVISNYTDHINKFNGLIIEPTHSFIPDFIINELREFYMLFNKEISADANGIIDYFKSEARRKFSMNLEVVINVLFESNFNHAVDSLTQTALQIIPSAYLNDLKKEVFDVFTTEINDLLANAKERKEDMIKKIELDLDIDYKAIRQELNNISNNINSVISKAQEKAEDMKNITNFFEFNSYEKAKQIKYVLENYIYPTQGFNLNKNLYNNLKQIHQNIFDKNYEILPNRFTKLNNVNTNSLKIVNTSIKPKFLMILENIKTQINYFVKKDISITDQILKFSNDYIEFTKNNFNKKYVEVHTSLINWMVDFNKNMTTLIDKSNNDVNEKNIVNFQNYANAMNQKLSKVFNSLKDDTIKDFHYKIEDFVKLIKKDCLNNTQVSLYKFSMNLQNIKLLDENIIVNTELEKFREDALKEMSNLLEISLRDKSKDTEISIKTLLEGLIEKSWTEMTNEFTSSTLDNQNILLKSNLKYLDKCENRNNSDHEAFADNSVQFNNELLALMKAAGLLMDSVIDLGKREYLDKYESYLDNQYQNFTIENILSEKLTESNFLFQTLINTYNNFKTDSFRFEQSITSQITSSIRTIDRFLNIPELIDIAQKDFTNNLNQMTNLIGTSLSNINKYLTDITNKTQSPSMHIYVLLEIKIFTQIIPSPSLISKFIAESTNFGKKEIDDIYNDLNSFIFDQVVKVSNSLDPGRMNRLTIDTILKAKDFSTTVNQLTLNTNKLYQDKIFLPLQDYTETVYNKVILNDVFRKFEATSKYIKDFIKDPESKQNTLYKKVFELVMFYENYELKIFKMVDEILGIFENVLNMFTKGVDDINKMFDDFINKINNEIESIIDLFRQNIIDGTINPIVEDKVLKPVKQLKQTIEEALVEVMDRILVEVTQIIDKVTNKDYQIPDYKRNTRFLALDSQSESDRFKKYQEFRQKATAQAYNINEIFGRIGKFNQSLNSCGVNMEKYAIYWSNFLNFYEFC